MSRPLPVEGTFHLEGLLEAEPLAPGQFDSSIREWTTLTRRDLGLHFHAQFEGDTLNVMPDDRWLDERQTAASAEAAIEAALQNLLERMTGDRRPRIDSTIRSVRIGKGKEVQTLYAVNQEGKLELRSREQAADTAPPPFRPSRRQRLQAAAAAATVILTLFLLSSLFVDYRALFSGLIGDLRPIDFAAVQVESGPFEPWLAVEVSAGRRFRNELEIRVTPSPRLRRLLLDLQRGELPPELPWRDRLAVEAVARGILHIAFVDDEGEAFGFTRIRLSNLEEAEEAAKVNLPRPRRSFAAIRLDY